MNARLLGPLVLIGLAAWSLAACGTGGGATVEATGAGNAQAAPAGKVGDLAPDFSLNDLEGQPVKLSDSAGKVRLVDFWALWCAPCKEEIPMFKELHATYAGEGFELIAIYHSEESAEEVLSFVRDQGIEYTNLIGNDEVADGFGGVLGLPTAILIDEDGRIVKKFLGPKPQKALESKIRELLGLEPLTG